MDQNLFDLLISVWEKECAEKGIERPFEQSATAFVAFARSYLNNNQPVGTAMVARGLAVKLQQGHIVTFATDEAKTDNPIRAVLVTGKQPDLHGGTLDGHAIHITDPRR